jgi:tetratricopeptide (TPR) repeat protein
MGYDIIIVRCPPERAMHVLARQLAASPDISLQRAMLILEQAPLAFAKDLSKQQLAREIPQLQKLGVQIRIAESPPRMHKKETGLAEIAPDNAAAGQIGDHAPNSGFMPDSEAPRVSGRASKGVAYHASKAPNPPPRPVRLGGAEASTRETRPVKTIASILLIIAAIVGTVMLFSYYKKPAYTIRRTEAFVSRSPVAMRSPAALSGKQGARQSPTDAKKSRAEVTAEDKTRALVYADSAKAFSADHQRAIKFFLIALSFNEYNLEAWHGLIHAYKDAGMHQEARNARQRMEKLFGEEIMSVNRAISRFGALVDASKDSRRIYRLEYRSSARTRQELEKETFSVMRALRISCGCTAASVYAATGKGSGMLAYLELDPFPSTLSAYLQRARITMLE